MENLKIDDSQITASTFHGAFHEARNSRLNFQNGFGRAGSWVARYNDVNQWLQVDFIKKVKLGKVGTQGRWDYDQWVTSYLLSYSIDQNHFQVYKHCGEVKVRLLNFFEFFFLSCIYCNPQR